MSSKQYSSYPTQGDINTLLEFINRLGNALRGLSGDIDKHLGKIKVLSDTNTLSLDALKPHFDAVMQALQREQYGLERRVRDAHQSANRALRAAQQTELEPAQQAQAVTLLERLDGPIHSYSELFPVLTEVVSLLDGAIASQQAATKPNLPQAFPQTLQGELSNLLATIDFRSHASSTLQSLRQRLIEPLTMEALLDACMGALRLIVRGINEERQSAQQFLLSLNDALASFNQALELAVNNHDQANNTHRVLGDKLTSQVRALEESVDHASTLAELKKSVQVQVSAISDVLVEKLGKEQQERQALHNQLLSMQARLEDVESEAQMYKRKLSEQKFKSLQDSLTRLPNRAAFEERLELEYQRWQSYAAPLAVAIADIDHFKMINDAYGHTAGDKTLQVIANMLKKSLRETDFVCRYGGEEFVIVFPQTHTEVALELLEKARHRIKSIPFKFKNKSISITISAGVASFTAQDTPSTVFERADRALYMAKDQGRDRVNQQ